MSEAASLKPPAGAAGWDQESYQVAYVTDVGLVRQTNQDSIFVAPLDRAGEDRGVLLAVADGMGGHQGGETASRTVVETLAGFYQQSGSADGAQDEVKNLVLEANRAIYRLSRGDPDLMGMGTTLTASIVQPGRRGLVLQIGDSRAYHRRGTTLTCITQDHSFVAEQIRLGNLTPEEAKSHPKRNVITRAVGTRPFLEMDSYDLSLEVGDDLLLCSDGLHGMVGDEALSAVLQKPVPAIEAVNELLEQAYRGGGQDNIAIILMRFQPRPNRSWLTRIFSFFQR